VAGDYGDAYSRTGAEWTDAVAAARAYLIEQSQLCRTTSYTELNAVLGQRTDVRAFDFGLDAERAAMGHLLGLVVAADRPTSGVMLSALVIYLNENDAGSGFYALATQLGVLPRGATADQKLEFWAAEVERVQAHYPRRRRNAL